MIDPLNLHALWLDVMSTLWILNIMLAAITLAAMGEL